MHRKYEYFENKHCNFWSKPGCFTASLDILNSNRLIAPEREGFQRLKFCQVYIGGIYVLLVMQIDIKYLSGTVLFGPQRQITSHQWNLPRVFDKNPIFCFKKFRNSNCDIRIIQILRVENINKSFCDCFLRTFIR